MKRVVLVVATGMLLLTLSGCQCGCLNSAVSQVEDPAAAWRQEQNPSSSAISTEMEFRAEYGKFF